MAKNRFERVKGTKDFLVATVVCVFVCLWSIRDAFFPTEKILKRHPLEFAVTNSVAGIVRDIPVEVGQEVGGEQVLLRLNPEHFEAAVAAAQAAYRAAVDAAGGPEGATREQELLLQARADLKGTTISCSDYILETTHGSDPLYGTVLEVIAEPATKVEAGSTLMLIQPKDTFYMFNKTLAVLMFLGAVIFAFFHRVASK